MRRTNLKMRILPLLIIVALLITQCTPTPAEAEQPPEAPAATSTEVPAAPAAPTAPSPTPLPSPTASPTPVIGPDAVFDSSNICNCRLMAELGKGVILDIAVSPEALQAFNSGKLASPVMAPAEGYVAAATGNGIRLFDAKTLEELPFTKTRDFASLVAIAPGSNEVAYSQGDRIAVAPIESGGLGEPKYLEGHTGSVNNLAYLPDHRLFSTATDQMGFVWDVGTGRKTAVGPFEGSARQVSIYGDGGIAILTSGSANGKSFSDVERWTVPMEIEPVKDFTIRRDSYFNSMDISADGKIALAGSSYPNSFEVLEGSGKLLTSIAADDQNRFYSVGFSPDSKSVALGGFNAVIGGPIIKDNTWFFHNASGPVRKVKYSRDSKYLFFYDTDGIYRVDSASGEVVSSATGFNAPINDLHFDNGSLYSTAYGSLFQKRLDYTQFYMQDTLTAGNLTVNLSERFELGGQFSPRISPDGRYFTSLLGYHKVGVFDTQTGSEVKTIDFGTKFYLNYASFLSPNKLFVSAYEQSFLYEVPSGKWIGDLTLSKTGEKDFPMNTFLSGDGRMAFFSTFTGHIKVYDIEGRKETADLYPQGFENPYINYSSIAVNQDGTLVIAGLDQYLFAWQLQNGTWINLWSQKTDGNVHSSLLMPDDLSVLAGLSNGEVNVYDIKDGSSKCGLVNLGPATVRVMKFSNDRRSLGFGSSDGMIRLLGTS